MQDGILKLDEVIWEITSKCNNGCSYCGSKEVTCLQPDFAVIDKVIERLVEFPPKKLDVSGGDPLTIPLEVHAKIVTKLREAGVKEIKMLVNPKSFKDEEQLKLFKQLQSMYDWIGISINTEEELEIAKQELWWLTRSTIITNFNIGNLFLFDEIGKFVKSMDLGWMIQFTIYKNENNPMAVYNSKLATKKLQELVNGFDGKIILSDNLSCGRCMAGIVCIGILYDGTVVPCLSMRSWCSNVLAAGNVMKESLKDMWINEFKENRFGKFKCCKDACKNVVITKNGTKVTQIIDLLNQKNIEDKDGIWNKKEPWPASQVVMYGVNMAEPTSITNRPYQPVYVYGVTITSQISKD